MKTALGRGLIKRAGRAEKTVKYQQSFLDKYDADNTALVKENASLKEQVDRITRGGCGKPGHTAFTSDEGTCYCLTCELEQENVTLKTQLAGAVIERNRLTDAINQRLAAVESGPLVDGDDPDVVLRDLVDHVAGFSQAALMIRVRELEEQLKGHYASPCIGYPDCDGDLIGYEHSSKCIAARLAGKEPAWGASENITVLPEEDHHA